MAGRQGGWSTMLVRCVGLGAVAAMCFELVACAVPPPDGGAGAAQPQASPTPQPLPPGTDVRHFACNEVAAVPRPGVGRRAEDYVGVKSRFSRTERINLAVYPVRVPSMKGRVLEAKVWLPDGGVKTLARIVCEWPLHFLSIAVAGPDKPVAMLGRYKFASFLDGMLLGECEFDITE